MFVGEMEFADLAWNKKDDESGFALRGLKSHVVFSNLVFILFVFFFVVVVMNLLNAVAIGDIQVCYWRLMNSERSDSFTQCVLLKSETTG